MPRDPRQIQLEIDAARENLAATLDQLVYRGNPKRLADQGRTTALQYLDQGRTAALQFLQTPAGKAALGAVGLLLSVRVVRKIRHRKDEDEDD